jgi:hypothetical protein
MDEADIRQRVRDLIGARVLYPKPWLMRDSGAGLPMGPLVPGHTPATSLTIRSCDICREPAADRSLREPDRIVDVQVHREPCERLWIEEAGALKGKKEFDDLPWSETRRCPSCGNAEVFETSSSSSNFGQPGDVTASIYHCGICEKSFRGPVRA